MKRSIRKGSAGKILRRSLQTVGLSLTTVLLWSLTLGTGFAFPTTGSGKTGAGDKEESLKADQPPQRQATSEELEKIKKASVEEAKKIVVARVNGADISMASLINMMNRVASKKKGQLAPEDAEAVKKEALDRLIFFELVYQKGKNDKVKVDENNIDAAISNLKDNMGGEEAYKKFLESEKVTENDLRAGVEKSLLLELMFAREVLEKTAIPDEELKTLYEKEKDRYVLPEKVLVIDVLFLLKTDDENSRKKAETILKEIQEEKDGDPWKLVLDGTFIVRNLDIKKEKHKELYDEARKLKPGELSGVIKAPDNFHIIKLKQYSPERQSTLEEARPTLERKLLFEAQERRRKEWEAELRKDAKIEIIEVKQGTQGTEDGQGKSPETEKKK